MNSEHVLDAISPLPRFDHATLSARLPRNGIYLFFEEGETLPLPSGLANRVVRVGTHNRDGRFRDRIRQHYGLVRSLGGHKNASVFRKHLGGALLRRADPTDARLPGWEKHMGPSYPEVEAMVSLELRNRFSFVCIQVDSGEERLSLESGLIATLARCALGRPSEGWLGNYAASPGIRQSGLWNTNKIGAEPLSPAQLLRLRELVALTAQGVARL
jgi:hypothetical protein